MQFSDIFSIFAERYGVSGIEPDENGGCSLGIDDMTVSFMPVPGSDKLLTYSELAEVPSEKPEMLFSAMLQANYLYQGTGGASFAQDPETKKIFLNRYDDLRFMDSDGFCTMLENFVNLVETWRKMIADYCPDEADTSAVEDALPSSAFGNSGFLSV